jgi:uncharacterized membrane protein
MKQTNFSITAEIPAPRPIVWSVISDIERWPEWTPSISRVRKLSPGPLQVGCRARVHQPKLPPAYWRVTEFKPGAGFAWMSVAPGVRVTARHEVQQNATGCVVMLSIHYEGFLGALLARCVGNLNHGYLTMEANGLKSRCIELASDAERVCDEMIGAQSSAQRTGSHPPDGSGS